MTVHDPGLAIFDRIPVDRINTEARQINLGRALLTLVAGLLYAIGWIVARTTIYLWIAITWCVAAVKVGARDGWQRPARDQPHRR